MNASLSLSLSLSLCHSSALPSLPPAGRPRPLPAAPRVRTSQREKKKVAIWSDSVGPCRTLLSAQWPRSLRSRPWPAPSPPPCLLHTHADHYGCTSATRGPRRLASNHHVRTVRSSPQLQNHEPPTLAMRAGRGNVSARASKAGGARPLTSPGAIGADSTRRRTPSHSGHAAARRPGPFHCPTHARRRPGTGAATASREGACAAVSRRAYTTAPAAAAEGPPTSEPETTSDL